jgi:branched-chain amino acid transport system permease protein
MRLPRVAVLQHATRAHRLFWLCGLMVLMAVATGPWWAEPSLLRLIGEFAYMLALAQMWNLLAGYGGLVSIGQQAFIGIGGYALLVFTMDLKGNPFLGVLVGGVAATVAALIVAPVLFRLRDAYFAIGTWVVAEVFRLLVSNVPAVGGGSGTSLTAALMIYPAWNRQALTFWIALALGTGSTLAAYLFLRSRLGLGLTAIRDSEVASESLGVHVRWLKLTVFVASALGCGLTGALISLTHLRISPDSAFAIDWSAAMIFIVVIGGIGTLEGPIVGTVIYLLLRNLLSDYGSWYMIALGAAGIATMLMAPMGVWGMVAKRFDLRIFPIQRRLRFIEQPTDPASEASTIEPTRLAPGARRIRR